MTGQPRHADNVLLVDIGNSRIKWRVLDLARGWLDTDIHGVLDHAEVLALGVSPMSRAPWAALDFACACISNVASDALLQQILAWLAGIPCTRLIPQAHQGGVTNIYARPEALGADRWAALIGARSLYPQQTLLLASLGTATTIDVLHANGQFAGGVILPGLELMRQSLAKGTARLPLAHGKYQQLADNTVDAIESGILHAQAGAIERVLRQTGAQSVRCLLTGGGAALMLPLLPVAAQIEDNLVLRGLAQVACEELRPGR